MAFEELLQLLARREAVDAKQDEVMRLIMLATTEGLVLASGEIVSGDPEYAAAPGGEAMAEAGRRAGRARRGVRRKRRQVRVRRRVRREPPLPPPVRRRAGHVHPAPNLMHPLPVTARSSSEKRIKRGAAWSFRVPPPRWPARVSLNSAKMAKNSAAFVTMFFKSRLR
uniref:Uncharacterized protein n=1 Tax=Setaria viridis TaxID=4556 RepID=A0A4U6V1Q0_SETVI|nr:hypothetical protein SEVIR_4G216401v2 [Setaria viridis]